MFIILRVIVFLFFALSGYMIGIKYNNEIYGVLTGGVLGLIAIVQRYN